MTGKPAAAACVSLCVTAGKPSRSNISPSKLSKVCNNVYICPFWTISKQIANFRVAKWHNGLTQRKLGLCFCPGLELFVIRSAARTRVFLFRNTVSNQLGIRLIICLEYIRVICKCMGTCQMFYGRSTVIWCVCVCSWGASKDFCPSSSKTPSTELTEYGMVHNRLATRSPNRHL